ncbi:MAG: hypothetical protein ACLVMI_03040 [Clostridia bacterium]|jgi:hypothetical protein
MNELKSFDDFTSSLTPADLEYINQASSFSGNLTEPADLEKFIGYLGGMSFGRMLRLLELYHEWLQK